MLRLFFRSVFISTVDVSIKKNIPLAFQPQLNGKSVIKATPNITSISNVNSLNPSFNKIQPPNANISIQKPTHIVASSVSSPIYQFNLPQAYHQMIPSSPYSTTQASNNSLFIGNSSITSTLGNTNLHQQQTAPTHAHPQNSFNHLNNLNPLTSVLSSPSIISSNSYSAGFGGGPLSQGSSGWYYDSLVDNVDDFLP